VSFHSFDQQDFDKWKRGLERNYKNPGWDKYDADLQRIVNAFDQFHAPKGNGYVPPQWQLMKAQLWVEGGGPPQKRAWQEMPMQIGVPTDRGILDVTHHPHVPLISPPDLRRNFDLATIRSNPVVNIQAGMTLLHLKMAFFATRPKPVPSVPQPASNATPPTRQPAAAAPMPHPLVTPAHRANQNHPQKEAYVCAWRPFNPVTLYQQYNIGDGAYAAKLNFCLELISS